MGTFFAGPGSKSTFSVCDRFDTRITLVVSQTTHDSSQASSQDLRRKSQEKYLAELATNSYSGPHRIEGTRIDEYRVRNTNIGAPIFSFEADDNVRIAECVNAAPIGCKVSVWDIKGLNIRYEFGIDLVREWPEIDAVVIGHVVSFVENAEFDR